MTLKNNHKTLALGIFAALLTILAFTFLYAPSTWADDTTIIIQSQ